MALLEQANQILENISLFDGNITPVSLHDYPLFQRFFDKEERHTHGNAWTYVTQGVYGLGPHNLGYKYYDGENLSIIGVYPKVDFPEQLVMYWIRPMGPKIMDIILDKAAHVVQQFGIFTYVKKVFKEEFDYLHTRGFHDVSHFPWHAISPQEDDTYPELIFEVAETCRNLQESPNRTSIRQTAKKATQLAKKNETIFIEEEAHDNYTAAWNIALTFFSMDSIVKYKKNLSNPNDYYNPIFNNPARTTKLLRTLHVDRKPSGFYLYEQSTPTYSSAYALLSLRDDIRNANELLFTDLFHRVSTKFLNLGGSENKGIHHFKLKFKVVKTQQMYWATNYSR